MKVAFLNLFVKYDTIPLVISLIKSLIKKGVVVDLFSVEEAPLIKRDGKKFNIIVFKKILFNTFSPLLLIFYTFNYINREKYEYIFAVDTYTIFPALILGKAFRKKLIFVSLEIFVKKDINNIFAFYYYLQQKYLLRFFDYIIIMDKSRRSLLEKNAKINRKTTFYYLPNSTLCKNNGNSDKFFLHKKLSIDFNKKIILIAGEIDERSYLSELINISERLSNDFVIVLHSRRKVDINIVKNGKIFLSNSPVNSEELDKLYSSAYIGLALYKISGKGLEGENLRVIGKSSGKANNFLKMGVPIIMSKLPYFEYIEKKYLCGVCIDEIHEIIGAIETIEENYSKFKNGAFHCFENELNFNKFFEKFYISLFQND